MRGDYQVSHCRPLGARRSRGNFREIIARGCRVIAVSFRVSLSYPLAQRSGLRYMKRYVTCIRAHPLLPSRIDRDCSRTLDRYLILTIASRFPRHLAISFEISKAEARAIRRCLDSGATAVTACVIAVNVGPRYRDCHLAKGPRTDAHRAALIAFPGIRQLRRQRRVNFSVASRRRHWMSASLVSDYMVAQHLTQRAISLPISIRRSWYDEKQLGQLPRVSNARYSDAVRRGAARRVSTPAERVSGTAADFSGIPRWVRLSANPKTRLGPLPRNYSESRAPAETR